MAINAHNLQERTYRYALDVIRLLESLNKDYMTQTLARQLLRSATSIGANVVEAQAASSKKDFANFYSHSLKSAKESKYWLELLRDGGKVSREMATSLVTETEELAKILAASLLTVRGKRRT